MQTPINDTSTDSPLPNNQPNSVEFPDMIEQKKSTTGTSFLTIIALIIVMVIVAIILTGDLLKESKEKTLTFQENNPQMIAPELELQTTHKKTIEVEEKEEELSLSKLLEEDEFIEEDISIEELTIQKKEIEKSPKITQTISIPKTTRQTTTSQNNYYIQIGSYSKVPSRRFLSVIKNRGFDYILTPPSHKGIKKLLIGPYPSRTKATSKLHTIKDNFNKHAFIVKR